MWNGTPVVASDVGGVREIVQTAVAGRVVPQPDGPSLAAAVDDLLRNRPARAAVRAYAQASLALQQGHFLVCA